MLKVLILFLPFHVIASLEYRWIRANPDDIFSGECFEVDDKLKVNNLKKDEISKYFKSVNDRNCRPEKTYYSFHPDKEKCFELDSETNGENFLNKVDLKYCRPEKTVFKYLNRNDKYVCHEVDSRKFEIAFSEKVSNDLCVHEKTLVEWKRHSDKSGYCYDVTNNFNPPPKINNKFCIPPKTNFLFVKDKELSGYCLEISADSTNSYSKSVDIKKCRPENIIYFFYKKPGKKSGKCYEIDSETRGQQYINSVSDSKCRESIVN